MDTQDKVLVDQTGCELLGCEQLGVNPDWSKMASSTEGLISIGLSIIFVIIIIIGVFQVIKAGVAIIQSEGDSAKIEEGTKTLKGVFIGVIMIIVGIVGVFIILAFLQSGNIVNVTPEAPAGLEDQPLPLLN